MLLEAIKATDKEEYSPYVPKKYEYLEESEEYRMYFQGLDKIAEFSLAEHIYDQAYNEGWPVKIELVKSADSVEIIQNKHFDLQS